MNRREFSKTVALSAAGFSLLGCAAPPSYTADELMGRVAPNLVGEAQLRPEASAAFDRMAAAARQDGIDIKVVSSYRSYTRQEQIFSGKYQRFTNEGSAPLEAIERIIEYSTIPGTSRHHWGSDLDVIQGRKPGQQDSLLARHFEEGGVYGELKLWLDENKESFGFYEVYTNDPDRKGFSYEPWHLSYRPMSYDMLLAYKEIDLKAELQSINLIGSEHFTDEFIDRYIRENILDINPDLL